MVTKNIFYLPISWTVKPHLFYTCSGIQKKIKELFPFPLSINNYSRLQNKDWDTVKAGSQENHSIKMHLLENTRDWKYLVFDSENEGKKITSISEEENRIHH